MTSGAFKNRFPAGRLATAMVVLAAVASPSAIAQISLTSDFLPFEIGHERAYATHSGPSTDVAGLVGGDGGPQLWDFTLGPNDETYYYRNFAPPESPSPGAFPGATIAERLLFTSTGATGFAYYSQTPLGRDLHGFHDLIANPDFPLVVFQSPLRDFPRNLEFGSQWTGTTTFETQQILLGSVFDLDVTVHIESRIDAFGTLRLPGFGDIEVLRVNELDRQETLLDTGGEPLVLSDVYVRVFYWISREYGIVAQITSEAGEQIPPADTLGTASRFLRLIEFRNPSPFRAEIVLLDGETARLSWNSVPGVETYAIERTTTLREEDWEHWTSTDSNSIDVPTDLPFRYFRVTPTDP